MMVFIVYTKKVMNQQIFYASQPCSRCGVVCVCLYAYSCECIT